MTDSPLAPRPPPLVGLNYWPADTAMLWWSRFDLEAVRAELARIAEAGFGYLRFFLLWEAFQPEPETVHEPALRDLEQFADAAHAVGLRLQPTLFTGHMSGANWLPEFATVPSHEGPRRFPTIVGGEARRAAPANFYAEERLIGAQELLAREVARALARHPALWSWDLGNEPSNVTIPETRDQGRRWLARMVGALRAGGAEHPVTIGLHMEDLEEDRRIGPREAAEACDYLCMHGYPMYAGWVRHDLDATLLPFLGLLTRWLGGDRPVLFQEFGIPTHPPGRPAIPDDIPAREAAAVGRHVRLFDEQEAAAYYRAALAELRRERFLGAFAWCANDYVELLWTRPPFAENEHECFFGLFRADGSPKPSVDAWREVGPTTAPERGIGWIDLEPDQFWNAPARELRRLYARFVEL